MFFSYVLISIALLILLLFLSYKRASLISVGAVFIFITHFLGYPLFHLRNTLDPRYDTVIQMGLNEPIVYSFFGFLTYVAVGVFFEGKTISKNSIQLPYLINFKLIKSCYLLLFLISISLYIVINGVSLNLDGNYGDRLTDNAGNGWLLINMPAFVVVIILSSMNAMKKSDFILTIPWILFFGLCYFVVIGGSRNVFASAILIYLIIGYFKGFLSRKAILVFGFCAFLLLNFLILFRYNVSLSDMNIKEAVAIFISYFSDSISPLNYQVESVNFVMNSSAHIPHGWDLFFNQFLALIPRALWNDKPIVMMNSSYYFTQYILGFSGNLNMASTMLSSALIIMKNGYYVVYAAAAVFVALMDRGIGSKIFLIKMVPIISMPSLFFMARESLELYVFITFKYFLMLFFGYLMYLALLIFLPRKRSL